MTSFMHFGENLYAIPRWFHFWKYILLIKEYNLQQNKNYATQFKNAYSFDSTFCLSNVFKINLKSHPYAANCKNFINQESISKGNISGIS